MLHIQLFLFPGLREIQETQEIQHRYEINLSAQLVIITRTFNFHNESIHLPYTEINTVYEGLEDLRLRLCSLKVFANGHGEESKGWVTIAFGKNFQEITAEGSIIISVLDSSNNQRFSKTFNFTDSMFVHKTSDDTKLIINYIDFIYISRRLLLSDPDELLPEDKLTMMVELLIRIREISAIDSYNIYANQDLGSYLRTFHYSEPFRCELLLNSPLGESLSRESSVFRDMLDLIKMEEGEGFVIMPIKKKESMSFENCCNLLLGHDTLHFDSIKEIFDIYIIAEKFDIKTVMETSICFMKLYASVHTVGVLFTYATEYEEYHSNILREQITLISKSNLAEEIVKTQLDVRFIELVHNCLWTYQYSTGRRFFNINTPFLNPNEEEEADYDFYR